MRRTTFSYDVGDRLATVKDALTNVSTVVYDVANHREQCQISLSALGKMNCHRMALPASCYHFIAAACAARS